MFRSLLYDIDQLNYSLCVKRLTDLKPIQVEYDYKKILEVLKNPTLFKDRFSIYPTILGKYPIIITNDNVILDGHHRYLVGCVLNIYSEFLCIRIHRRYSDYLVKFIEKYLKTLSDYKPAPVISIDFRDINYDRVANDVMINLDKSHVSNLLSCNDYNWKKVISLSSYAKIFASKVIEVKERIYSGKYKLLYTRNQLPNICRSVYMIEKIKAKLSNN